MSLWEGGELRALGEEWGCGGLEQLERNSNSVVGDFDTMMQESKPRTPIFVVVDVSDIPPSIAGLPTTIRTPNPT